MAGASRSPRSCSKSGAMESLAAPPPGQGQVVLLHEEKHGQDIGRRFGAGNDIGFDRASMTSTESLGDEAEGSHDVLGFRVEVFDRRRDERARIFDFGCEQRRSLGFGEAQEIRRDAAATQDVVEGGSVAPGVISDVHGGKVKSEDLGDTNDIMQVAVSD